MAETGQLNDILRAAYDELHEAGSVSIAPLVLAQMAFAQIDPSGVSPLLVQSAAVLELRQLARQICARRNREQEDETESVGLFDLQLQPRYPASRENEEVYVLRAHLTEEERRQNSKRLRREAKSKEAHADALDAETDSVFRVTSLPVAVATR